MSGPAHARIQKRAAIPTSSSTPRLQRKCACDASGGGAHCDDCREKRLQRRAAEDWRGGDVPGIVHDVLRSPGHPLPSGTEEHFEARFRGERAPSATLSAGRPDALTVSQPGDAGEREADRMAERTRAQPGECRDGPGFDFSRVRIHTDSRAADSARAVSARAYTVGEAIVFGEGQYQPSTDSGRELLAHELAHTTQQAPRVSRAPGGPLDRQLPPHLPRAPTPRSAAAGTPCSTTGCPTKIPGSAEDFIPGGHRGQGSLAAPRPSVHVQKYAAAEAPQFLQGVRQVLVVANKDIVAKRVSWSDCPNPPAEDPSAGCIIVSALVEQEAAAYNQAKAPTISGESRDDWAFRIRRELSWAHDQIQFRRSPTPKLPAGNAGAMWELQALHGWLAGWPVDYERAMSAAPDEQEAQVQKYIDFRVESQYLGVRGILRRLRCQLSCAEVDESITRVFGEVSSSWPREMRDALLFGLMDPKRRLDWPPRPRAPQTMTFPAEPRPKMPPLYAPRTGFESEAGKSGETL